MHEQKVNVLTWKKKFHGRLFRKNRFGKLLFKKINNNLYTSTFSFKCMKKIDRLFLMFLFYFSRDCQEC